MKYALRAGALSVVLVGLLALPSAAQQGPPAGTPGGPPIERPPGGGGQAEPGEGTHNLQHLANVPRETSATQSDLAFWGDLAVAGTYDGFRLFDISNPNRPRQIGDLFRCFGAQGDVSIYENLVFRSVDAPQTSTDCDSTNAPGGGNFEGHFQGVQVFDISDPENPEHINSIYTPCGSHTHTLVPDDDGSLYIYVSSYPLGAGTDEQQEALCTTLEQDPVDGGHSKISIIEVDLDDPSWDGDTTVHAYHLDDDTAWGTWVGHTFRACHDISVFMELNLAAGACMSEAQLWDISDPLNPELLWRFDHPVVNPANIDLWHSSSFSWDGKIVAFADESGGGGAARCTDPDDLQGRIWFFDTESGELLANFKFPRSEPGICTMHNFNFIPQKHGRYTVVSAGYTGGTTVIDVNKLIELQADADPTQPAPGGEAEAEIAWTKAEDPPSNTWSSYWYNGYIYVNDHHRGLDVYRLRDGARAGAVKLPYLNPQTQIDVID